MPVFVRKAVMNLAFGQRFSRKFGCIATASAACLLLQGFGPFGGLVEGPIAAWAKTVPLDEEAMKLVDKLAHNPELMNVDYLRYNLGYPVKTTATMGNRTYYWHSLVAGKNNVVPHSELTQTLDSKGRVIKANYRTDLPESDVKLTDVYKKEMGEAQQAANAANANGANANANGPNGQASGVASLQSATSPAGRTFGASPTAGLPPTAGGLPPAAGLVPGQDWASWGQGGQRLCKQFYDQNCHPALQFSFILNTTVTYKQEQNRFYVNEVEVSYSGPPLPPPLPEHMQANVDDRRAKALAHSAKGSHQLAMPLLKEHLKEQPNDAEAHYALAVPFQKQSHINEAILEYHAAMNCAGNNTDITQKCTTGLQELHVLPTTDERMAFHDLKLKAHGQGFREGDEQSSTTRNNLIASQSSAAAGAINPINPPPVWTPANSPVTPPASIRSSYAPPNGASYGAPNGSTYVPPSGSSFAPPATPYAASPPAGAPFLNGPQFGSSSPAAGFGNSSRTPAQSYFSPPAGLRRPSSFSPVSNSAGSVSAPANARARQLAAKAPVSSASAAGNIPGLEPFDPVFPPQSGVQLDPGF
jgi:hypothetical protein